MACPFFDPAAPFSFAEWPDAPRVPLGDPYKGVCTVEGVPAPADHVRTCCNMGYARGTCPRFPEQANAGAPDAVRFAILRRDAGVASVRYVMERDHHPFEDGTIDVPETSPHLPADLLLARQARAFVASYLRRNG